MGTRPPPPRVHEAGDRREGEEGEEGEDAEKEGDDGDAYAYYEYDEGDEEGYESEDDAWLDRELRQHQAGQRARGMDPKADGQAPGGCAKLFRGAGGVDDGLA